MVSVKLEGTAAGWRGVGGDSEGFVQTPRF